MENKLRVITAEVRKVLKIEHCPEGGLLTYFEGEKYPVHGALTDEALWATEMLKKYVISWIRMLAGRPQRYFLVLLFPFFKTISQQWLFQFSRYSEAVVSRYVNPELLSPAVAEFYRICVKLWPKWKLIILGLCAILENDKYYRWVWQDLMMAADRLVMINRPAREMTRLLKIYLRREKRPEYQNLKRLKLFFYIPSIRKAISLFALNADFERFKMDRYDFHQCLRIPNYDFDDKSLKERLEIVNRL